MIRHTCMPPSRALMCQFTAREVAGPLALESRLTNGQVVSAGHSKWNQIPVLVEEEAFFVCLAVILPACLSVCESVLTAQPCYFSCSNHR